MDIITKRGAFFTYGDVKLGQGRENGKDFLKANPEIASEIEAAIRSNVEKATELAKASLYAAPNKDEDEPEDALAIAESVVEAAEEEESAAA